MKPFKQILTITSLLLIAMPAMSQARLVDRVQQTSHQINDKIQYEAANLSQAELQSILQNFRAIRQTLRGRGPGRPIPTPPPSRGIDSKAVILSAMQVINGSESKSKAGQAGMVATGIDSMERLASSCSKTKTWSDNARCLEEGISSLRGYFAISESIAPIVINTMCVKTKTWNEEATCFQSAVEASGSHNLHNRVVGCDAIHNSESKSKCYREALK